MHRKQFLRAAVGGAASVLLAPVFSGCGGVSGGDGPASTAGLGDAVGEALAGGRTSAPLAAPVSPSAGPAPAEASLTDREIADMRFMREEEKLAHDVYVAMHARWGLATFGNIAASETQHTEAVLARLVAHGIDDPAAGRAPGSFEDTGLQALYDRLVATGSESLIAALSVGALIEEKDIQDIRDKMAQTDEADVIAVYQNLLCGSYSHLLAFNRQLSNRGVAYAAQVIPQAEWDAIVAGTAVCTAG